MDQGEKNLIKREGKEERRNKGGVAVAITHHLPWAGQWTASSQAKDSQLYLNLVPLHFTAQQSTYGVEHLFGYLVQVTCWL